MARWARAFMPCGSEAGLSGRQQAAGILLQKDLWLAMAKSWQASGRHGMRQA